MKGEYFVFEMTVAKKVVSYIVSCATVQSTKEIKRCAFAELQVSEDFQKETQRHNAHVICKLCNGLLETRETDKMEEVRRAAQKLLDEVHKKDEELRKKSEALVNRYDEIDEVVGDTITRETLSVIDKLKSEAKVVKQPSSKLSKLLGWFRSRTPS